MVYFLKGRFKDDPIIKKELLVKVVWNESKIQICNKRTMKKKEEEESDGERRAVKLFE